MKRIKEERVKRGLNQTAIARYLNISQSTYSKIEKGSQKLLAEDLVKLAFFLICRLMIFGDDSMSNKL